MYPFPYRIYLCIVKLLRPYPAGSVDWLSYGPTKPKRKIRTVSTGGLATLFTTDKNPFKTAPFM